MFNKSFDEVYAELVQRRAELLQRELAARGIEPTEEQKRAGGLMQQADKRKR
jgi:hypothetical protein